MATNERIVGLQAAQYALESNDPFDNLLTLCYALGLKDDPEVMEVDSFSRHNRYKSRIRKGRNDDPAHFRNKKPKEESPKYKRFKE